MIRSVMICGSLDQTHKSVFVEDKEVNMERLDAFEAMLSDIQKEAAYEKEQMALLKAAGKEKTATYRQYFGNQMLYRMMLDKYKQYGLI